MCFVTLSSLRDNGTTASPVKTGTTASPVIPVLFLASVSA